MNRDQLLEMCSRLSDEIVEISNNEESSILLDSSVKSEIERLDQLIQSLPWFKRKTGGEEESDNENVLNVGGEIVKSAKNPSEIKCPKCDYVFFKIS